MDKSFIWSNLGRRVSVVEVAVVLAAMNYTVTVCVSVARLRSPRTLLPTRSAPIVASSSIVQQAVVVDSLVVQVAAVVLHLLHSCSSWTQIARRHKLVRDA